MMRGVPLAFHATASFYSRRTSLNAATKSAKRYGPSSYWPLSKQIEPQHLSTGVLAVMDSIKAAKKDITLPSPAEVRAWVIPAIQDRIGWGTEALARAPSHCRLIGYIHDHRGATSNGYPMAELQRFVNDRQCMALVHEDFNPQRPLHWIGVKQMVSPLVFHVDYRDATPGTPPDEVTPVNWDLFCAGWKKIFIRVRNPG